MTPLAGGLEVGLRAERVLDVSDRWATELLRSLSQDRRVPCRREPSRITSVSALALSAKTAVRTARSRNWRVGL